MQRGDFKTIDEYIETFPKEIQKLLRVIRQTVKKAAPEAGEKISYQIPTFTFHGNLVHFAAFRDHLSFFRPSQGLKPSKKSSCLTKQPQVRFNSRLITPCR